MSAREIIARWLFGYVDRDSRAANILADLTAAGYRILAPGDLDKETLERAAQVADDFANKPVKIKTPNQFERTKQVAQTGKRVANAIRVLSDGGAE